MRDTPLPARDSVVTGASLDSVDGPHNRSAVIECRDLTRRFGSFTAVDNISFTVEEGAICAFLGPNGSGKSTTIKMLTGLLRQDSGAVHICGVSTLKEPAQIRRRIGVLPENLGLFDNLSIREHLELTGRIYGLGRAETQRRTDSLLEVLRLTDSAATLCGQGSHGMRKKTAFAMALLPNPEVLFLDEPFEAIDPVTARTVSDLLRRAASRRITVFLTSQILSLIDGIATHVIVVRRGRILLDLPVHQLEGRLEGIYFDLLGLPETPELEWLGS